MSRKLRQLRIIFLRALAEFAPRSEGAGRNLSVLTRGRFKACIPAVAPEVCVNLTAAVFTMARPVSDLAVFIYFMGRPTVCTVDIAGLPLPSRSLRGMFRKGHTLRALPLLAWPPLFPVCLEWVNIATDAGTILKPVEQVAREGFGAEQWWEMEFVEECSTKWRMA
ncbi:unnamed protein product [Polarella glacialis]|uniref:Uncharacterized protein n=1 Tax=Polarella glacialis TaxID=89957 RepID=A0A813FH15_POLGL|nr:unnamed protein product [Polarella glacialis]